MAMAQEVSTESLDSIINALELKEVIVTAKKIRQSGDTISYSAATYRGKNDKTLEDLLRKMPGIEVKADGQITYNGQWINEFYIEGHNTAIYIEWSSLIQKTNLNNIQISIHQPLKNADKIVMSKFPIIYVPAVAQSTVK